MMFLGNKFAVSLESLVMPLRLQVVRTKRNSWLQVCGIKEREQMDGNVRGAQVWVNLLEGRLLFA